MAAFRKAAQGHRGLLRDSDLLASRYTMQTEC